MKKKITSLWKQIEYRYRTASIRFVISVSFTIITVFSMVFSGMLMYMRFSASSEAQSRVASEQLVNQVNLNLEEYVRSMMRISDSMYFSVIKNTDIAMESFDKEMDLLYEANKGSLISIACFQSNGELVGAAPVSSTKKDVDIANQDWYIRANEKIENLHFSTPHVQNLFDENSPRYYWVISLSRMVQLTKDGMTERGVLLVDMNYNGIERLFKKVNTGGSGYIYLIDGEGELIYHPRQKAIYASLNQENNLAAAEYPDGNHSEVFEGKQRFVTVKTVGYTGWKIVSVIPKDEFYLNLNQIRFFVVAIIVLTILLVTIINMLVSSKIATPIQRLEDSVKELESGILDVNIYVGGSQEIRHLGRTVRSMVVQMRKLMDDIVGEQEEKRKSELDALQSQINPHFLYNTLDSIVWMIEVEEYQEAITMVTALASLFRISLSKGKTVISIEDELQHARNYMNIQMIRYKNRFTYTMAAEPAVLPCCTIKLIVQPILENAIYYGMEHMDGDGEINVRAYRQDGDIFIDVTDNGLGMPQETVAYLLTDSARVQRKGSGVGLMNVHQRIRLYFGAAYGLEITSEPDEGTRVRIHLPDINMNDAQDMGERREKP